MKYNVEYRFANGSFVDKWAKSGNSPHRGTIEANSVEEAKDKYFDSITSPTNMPEGFQIRITPIVEEPTIYEWKTPVVKKNNFFTEVER